VTTDIRGTIEARGLTRTYRTRGGDIEAVRGVDLDVAHGEIVGFLGPNGAGKTTTLRILTTLIAPTAGSAVVAGADVARDPVAVRRRIGYVPQRGSTLDEALVSEELVSQARLFGLTRAKAVSRSQEVLETLDLSGVWQRPAKSLSGGQRRRLDIAMGLLHGPVLVFLDEPSTGLDPQARANLWDHIRSLREVHGSTVFLTTHYLDEADALCDRVLVIDEGRIVADGAPAELKAHVSGDTVDLDLTDGAQAGQAAALVSALLGQAAGEVTSAQVHQSGAHIARISFRAPDAGRLLPGMLRDLDAAGVKVSGLETRRPSLDDVFLSLTGRSLRDDA